MYSNLGTEKTNKKVKVVNKSKEKLNRIKFIPDTNTIASHTEIISKVCPRSGWDKSKTIVGNKIIVVNEYFKYKFFLFKDIIKDIIITKKGFKISIGWNLGSDPKSSHLLDPLTSTPIIGTKIKAVNAKKNSIADILIRISWFKKENSKIIKIPIVTNAKCFKKK